MAEDSCVAHIVKNPAVFHIYIHTYIHTYMHACMHACMHVYGAAFAPPPCMERGRSTQECDADAASAGRSRTRRRRVSAVSRPDSEDAASRSADQGRIQRTGKGAPRGSAVSGRILTLHRGS